MKKIVKELLAVPEIVEVFKRISDECMIALPLQFDP
jgi:hypothetical protein